MSTDESAVERDQRIRRALKHQADSLANEALDQVSRLELETLSLQEALEKKQAALKNVCLSIGLVSRMQQVAAMATYPTNPASARDEAGIVYDELSAILKEREMEVSNPEQDARWRHYLENMRKLRNNRIDAAVAGGVQETVFDVLDDLTDEQRSDVFSAYCRWCGSRDIGCHCRNVE